MSFQDRFRDRAEHIGRDGQRAQAPNNAGSQQLQAPNDPPWLIAAANEAGGSVIPGFNQRSGGATFAHNLASGSDPAAANPAGVMMSDQDSSVTGRQRHVKPPLPDFREIALVQFGRRAGQATLDRAPVLVDHPVTGNYHQHNLKEYREMLESYEHQKFGGLGAEDNEEKRREREKRRKMFDYGDAVTSVNVAVMDATGEDWHNRPIVKKPTAAALLAMQKKERATLYSEQWAPRPESKLPSPHKVTQIHPKSHTPQPGHGSSGGALIDEQLLSLEEKHRKDLETIARIKKQLNLA